MPDVEAAVERVCEALAPGARLVVFDVRCVPSGPLCVLNPLVSWFYQWYANWNADEDVVEALRAVFERVEVEETYLAGTAYRAVTTKPEE